MVVSVVFRFNNIDEAPRSGVRLGVWWGGERRAETFNPSDCMHRTMDSDVGFFPGPPSSARKDPIPHGPVSLPANATIVSDADEEIFLLYTRLATLKPPDSSDTGHFHGLGSENSKEDVLLVRIELKPPSTTHPSPSKPEKVNPNADRRNRARKRKSSSSKSGIMVGHGDGFGTRREGGAEPQALVFEYKLFQDKTALRSRSGDTGSVLWKAR